jgi:hypothetical protein
MGRTHPHVPDLALVTRRDGGQTQAIQPTLDVGTQALVFRRALAMTRRESWSSIVTDDGDRAPGT